MGLFDRNMQAIKLNFSTRSEAFNYMLTYLVDDKKIEPLKAAKQANEFADIFASNNGLPNIKEPEQKGVDKYISMAEKIGSYIESHPKVVEYGVPALTFLAGLFTGKKAEQLEDQQQYQSIRYRNPASDFPPIDDTAKPQDDANKVNPEMLD